MNKEDIDPANVRIRPMREEDVNATAVIDSMSLETPRPEYYREELGSATKGAGINTFLVRKRGRAAASRL